METQLKQHGSLLGAILLVAGCCIGAGMLGLPILSAIVGFEPSFVLFIGSWLFMLATGLLLLEVTLYYSEEINIISMAERILGRPGKFIAWSGYLFLFYCLMVAYISASGQLLADALKNYAEMHITPLAGSLICTAILGMIIYLGTQVADYANRLLMAGLVISYLCLIAFATPHVDHQLLFYKDWALAFGVLPVMLISFGYHNLVPSLSSYLNYDRKRLRLTFIIGSAIPLLVYLVWEYIVLGLIPVEGEGGFKEALEQGLLISQILNNASSSPWIAHALEIFAFCALVTSFIGVALSFLDFLADGLHVKKTPLGRILLSLLVLLPPLVCALIYPYLFLEALGYAGGIGTVILFGMLPVVMVWMGRYKKKLWSETLVSGGKVTLVVIMFFALSVMIMQIFQDLL